VVGKRIFKREGAEYKISFRRNPVPNDITVGESIIARWRGHREFAN